MISHVLQNNLVQPKTKCCTLMCVNQSPNDTVQCGTPYRMKWRNSRSEISPGFHNCFRNFVAWYSPMLVAVVDSMNSEIIMWYRTSDLIGHLNRQIKLTIEKVSDLTFEKFRVCNFFWNTSFWVFCELSFWPTQIKTSFILDGWRSEDLITRSLTRLYYFSTI